MVVKFLIDLFFNNLFKVWNNDSGRGLPVCHGVGRDINVQCVLIKEMIIIVDHYTLAVRNRR
jgi:hypothetical protein